MHTYILSLGTNIAPRLLYLRFALFALSRRGEILAVSSVYETSPVGMPESGGAFLNCALAWRSYLDPCALLGALKTIEKNVGRDLTKRMEARTLDIDIITWSGGEWHDERLDIPHPRARERLFVIIPYNELCEEKFELIQDKTQSVRLFCGGDILLAHPEDIQL